MKLKPKATDAQISLLVVKAAQSLKAALAGLSPREAELCLCAIVANVVGPIPGEDWLIMNGSAMTPCGNAGCRCEVSRTALMRGLTMQRDMWRRAMERGGKS